MKNCRFFSNASSHHRSHYFLSRWLKRKETQFFQVFIFDQLRPPRLPFRPTNNLLSQGCHIKARLLIESCSTFVIRHGKREKETTDIRTSGLQQISKPNLTYLQSNFIGFSTERWLLSPNDTSISHIFVLSKKFFTSIVERVTN